MHPTAALVGFWATFFLQTCLAQRTPTPTPLRQLPTPTPLAAAGTTAGTGAGAVAQFGLDQGRAVSFAGTSELQEAVFVDGLRFQLQSPQPLRMNVVRQAGLSRVTMPLGLPSLNSFAYVVNTSAPFSVLDAAIDVPVDMAALDKIVPDSPSTNAGVRGAVLMVARRPLDSGAIMFERIANQEMPFMPITASSQPMSSVRVSSLAQVDGEYIVLVGNPDDASIFDTQQQQQAVRKAMAQAKAATGGSVGLKELGGSTFSLVCALASVVVVANLW